VIDLSVDLKSTSDKNMCIYATVQDAVVLQLYGDWGSSCKLRQQMQRNLIMMIQQSESKTLKSFIRLAS